jgi:hypothetical protein
MKQEAILQRGHIRHQFLIWNKFNRKRAPVKASAENQKDSPQRRKDAKEEKKKGLASYISLDQRSMG